VAPMKLSQKTALALAVALELSACRAPLRMCDPSTACAATLACVSGRCVVPANVGAQTVSNAQRFVYRPTANQATEAPNSGFARLGHGQTWALRFLAVPITDVVEAYVLLRPVPRLTQSATDVHAEYGGIRPLFPTRAGATSRVMPAFDGQLARVRIDVQRLVKEQLEHSAEALVPIELTVVGDASSSESGDGIVFDASGEGEPLLEVYGHQSAKR
jgi:hypothetical protein